MVEASQYCRCRCRMSDVHGGSRYLLQEGWTPVPANTSGCLVACDEPRYVHPVWQILEPIPWSMCRDTQGGFTIWEFLAAPTILCVRVAAEHCFVQGMVPGTVVLTCEPCLAFLRTPSGSFRAGVPGRMVPSRFWHANRRIAMSKVFYEPRSKTRGRSRRRSSGQAF